MWKYLYIIYICVETFSGYFIKVPGYNYIYLYYAMRVVSLYTACTQWKRDYETKKILKFWSFDFSIAIDTNYIYQLISDTWHQIILILKLHDTW